MVVRAGRNIPLEDWNVSYQTLFRQANTDDCGIFVAIIALRLLQNSPLPVLSRG